MILLDSDHVTLLKYAEGDRGTRLLERLKAQPPDQVVACSNPVVSQVTSVP